jgi:hypothetical protein
MADRVWEFAVDQLEERPVERAIVPTLAIIGAGPALPGARPHHGRSLGGHGGQSAAPGRVDLLRCRRRHRLGAACDARRGCRHPAVHHRRRLRGSHPHARQRQRPAAALRNWVINLDKELAGSGVHAAHVAINVWIGGGGPEGFPTATPEVVFNA